MTGWTLGSRWGPNPRSVVSPIRSAAAPAPSFDDASSTAAERWGRLRVGHVDAAPSWRRRDSETLGPYLGFAGPDADARALLAARDLLEHGLADAVVLCSGREGAAARLLLERTAHAAVHLVDVPQRADGVLQCPGETIAHAVALPSDFEGWMVGAVVVGVDVVAEGGVLPGGSIEPERLSVHGCGIAVGLELHE